VGFYNWIQRHAPWLHHLYFNFLEVTAPCRSARRLLGKKNFEAALEEFQPDVLLSVHPSLNHGYFEQARTVRKKIRCVTYCGELFGGYGFSRHWANPAADLFIGAVAETGAAAAARGVPAAKIETRGFLLRPPFYEAAPSPDFRRHYIVNELQFDPDQFILLLSASSRGANNHLRFLEAIRRAGLDVQIVILCGKSSAVERQVQNWSPENSKLRLRILPHNTNVARLLRCVSAMVARPGTGATSEAILSECPILLNCLGGAMPQEWITVKYCRRHQLGETLHQPSDLTRIVAGWQKNPAARRAVQERMRAIRPPGHPRDILRVVANVA
jgi:processive 1,2-diacylglycerol beta-glucosyltransferase